jgi:hypothetical protein
VPCLEGWLVGVISAVIGVIRSVVGVVGSVVDLNGRGCSLVSCPG